MSHSNLPQSLSLSAHLIRGLAVLIPAAVIAAFYARTWQLLAIYWVYAYCVAVYFSMRTHLVKRFLHTGSVVFTLFVSYSLILTLRDWLIPVHVIHWKFGIEVGLEMAGVAIVLFLLAWLVYHWLDRFVCFLLTR